MVEGLDLRDEDRLPWLETVEHDEPERAPIGRIVAAILLGMGVVALVYFVVTRLERHEQTGTGEVIAAQPGDYKVKPDETGGLKVEGEGTSAIATSAGKSPTAGAIDLNAVPEKPVAAEPAAPAPKPAATPTAQPGHSAVAAVPAKGGKLVAAAPITAAKPATVTTGGGSLVQLGAFPTEAAANEAWAGFAKRFAYLAALGKSVQPVAKDGKTLYRLRVNAGSANQAADICGRLKVAGEACFVAS